MRIIKDEMQPRIDTSTIGASVLRGQRNRFRHLGPILVAGAQRRYAGMRRR